jgi:hypothetical protein
MHVDQPTPPADMPSEAASRRRKAQRSRRLPPNACCALCGERNPEMLKAVSRTILQAHHFVGRENDGKATVVLCLNHHAIVTAKQVDLNASFGKPVSLLDKAVSMLRSLAALFYSIADVLMDLAAQLAALLRALTENHPSWSQLPEAAA